MKKILILTFAVAISPTRSTVDSPSGDALERLKDAVQDNVIEVFEGIKDDTVELVQDIKVRAIKRKDSIVALSRHIKEIFDLEINTSSLIPYNRVKRRLMNVLIGISQIIITLRALRSLELHSKYNPNNILSDKYDNYDKHDEFSNTLLLYACMMAVQSYAFYYNISASKETKEKTLKTIISADSTKTQELYLLISEIIHVNPTVCTSLKKDQLKALYNLHFGIDMLEVLDISTVLSNSLFPLLHNAKNTAQFALIDTLIHIGTTLANFYTLEYNFKSNNTKNNTPSNHPHYLNASSMVGLLLSSYFLYKSYNDDENTNIIHADLLWYLSPMVAKMTLSTVLKNRAIYQSFKSLQTLNNLAYQCQEQNKNSIHQTEGIELQNI